MNKAITDGVNFMPPAFENGLTVWSSGDGTPGSDTYDGAFNAAFVPADQDFGGCLEMQKTEVTQKLRYMGETPLLPGCYLRITAKVKAVSGALPGVRIAGWAGQSGGTHVGGLVEVGPTVNLTHYGKVVEVSAIVGAGDRNGVDMIWGSDPIYGHFGLDLTGAVGGVVRVDDIVIEDITSAFLRSMMNWVDVRDFGAVGDGSTDDSAAFEAADAAAAGRRVVVPAGVYYLGESVTMNNRVEFEGRIEMPDDKYLSLTKDFDFPTYFDAFRNETTAFKKAFQALLNNADHEGLDLGGRRIVIDAPVDMQQAVGNKTEYSARRVIRNGQLWITGTTAWEPDVVTSDATYDSGNARTLTDVTNVANIAVGSLVEGAGVGREVYVRSKNNATGEITLSMPLFDAVGRQNFTFTRNKYILDFSSFDYLSKMMITDIEFYCAGKANGIMLAPSGSIMHVKDCHFTYPASRGITSIGEGCQGMLIDRCHFLSNEGSLRVQDRQSIGFNANANDLKLRHNRATRLKHFGIMAGSNNTIIGNHFFQGDTEPSGVRSAGLVLTDAHASTSIAGNYVDNCFVEWTNEHDATPGFTGGYSFSALSITDNVFLSGDIASWVGYIVIKPHGSGHFIGGLTVIGSKFRSIHGNMNRVDRIDTSFATLDMTRGKNILWEGNTYHAVDTPVYNPLLVKHDQNSANNTWTVETEGQLPFEGRARRVESVVTVGPIENNAGTKHYTMPYVETEQGTSGKNVHLKWNTALKGEALVKVRMD